MHKIYHFFLCTMLCYTSYGEENKFTFELTGNDLDKTVQTKNDNENCNACTSDHDEDLATAPSQKIYLQVDQINFHDSKIFVQILDEVFTVPAIYSDQNVFYIVKIKRCKSWEWTCDVCGSCNSLEDYRCPICNLILTHKLVFPTSHLFFRFPLQRRIRQ